MDRDHCPDADQFVGIGQGCHAYFAQGETLIQNGHRRRFTVAKIARCIASKSI